MSYLTASNRPTFAVVISLVASSIAGAQTRVEQGHEVLNSVRAMHLMIDFGVEALDPASSLDLAVTLSPKDEYDELGNDEWTLRRRMLYVERIGRDMIAGKPIPNASAKTLDEHFKPAEDPITGRGLNEQAARRPDEGKRRCREILQRAVDKLTTGKPLSDDELAVVCGRYASFRSGDQLNWRVVDLPIDVRKMVEAYSSSVPKNQHAIRILLGRRGKADAQATALILDAMRGTAAIERYDAAFATGKMRPPSDKLTAALINCLDDPDPRVARAAVRSLLSLNATQSAPAMLRRLRQAAGEREGADLDKEVGFGFAKYGIMDSYIGFRHDLPTELIFALGRLRHREALPLLWEIAQGKGDNVWQYHRNHEMDHGGVAFEAIAAIHSDDPVPAARRTLEMKSATVDALGAAANVLGERGKPTDILTLVAIMSRLDETARSVPDFQYQAFSAMSRVTFAAERLLFFADPGVPELAKIREALLAELRRCASGPFGEPIIAALEYFDPDGVEVTALALVADTKAEPNARRIAMEILGRTAKLEHVPPLLAAFEDDGNATNGPVGLHAAWATSTILAASNPADPRIATLSQRAGDKLERIEMASRWPCTDFLKVLIRIDSDRGVRICSSRALDSELRDLSRSIALDYIARFAEPNRDLALQLRPVLETPLPESQTIADLRGGAARAMARLLGLEADKDDSRGRVALEERVRQELAHPPRLK